LNEFLKGRDNSYVYSTDANFLLLDKNVFGLDRLKPHDDGDGGGNNEQDDEMDCDSDIAKMSTKIAVSSTLNIANKGSGIIDLTSTSGSDESQEKETKKQKVDE